jgi:prepilin-type processing-associated H-X9-DG protein
MDQIRDGAANTLLLSENTQAGPPDSPTGAANEPTSWLLSPTEQGDAFVWVNEPNPSPETQARINQGREVTSFSYSSPQFSRPSSNHQEGVNVVYCDGHVQFLREDIAYPVYQQLMTPHGSKAKIGPGPNDFPDPVFRGYILNSSDYQ